MKKAVVLTLAVALFFGFVELSKMWGSKSEIEWGTRFKATDSLEINSDEGSITGRGNYLYTSAFQLTDANNGVFRIAFSPDSVNEPLDSIDLDMRQGFKFAQNDIEWEVSWHPIFSDAKTDTVYYLNIASKDSTWWGPCNLVQFRTAFTDTNGVSGQDTIDYNPRLGVYFGKN